MTELTSLFSVAMDTNNLIIQPKTTKKEYIPDHFAPQVLTLKLRQGMIHSKLYMIQFIWFDGMSVT